MSTNPTLTAEQIELMAQADAWAAEQDATRRAATVGFGTGPAPAGMTLQPTVVKIPANTPVDMPGRKGPPVVITPIAPDWVPPPAIPKPAPAKPKAAKKPAPAIAKPPVILGTGVGEYIHISVQADFFAGCVYVQAINQMVSPEGDTLDSTQFDNDARFAGRIYAKTIDGGKGGITDSAWDCFTQSKVIQFPKVWDLYFDPRHEPSNIKTEGAKRYVNTWRALDIAHSPGDVSLFVDHIKLLLPNGDDALILTSYLAACVQYLGHKSSWAIFLQGVEGNGKSFFTKVLEYCLGKDYVHNPRTSDLGKDFNAAFYGKLLVGIEEVLVNEGKEELWNRLKNMITERRQTITPKNKDTTTRDLCFNFIFNSNHKDGLRKTGNDRRICPLFTAQQTKADLVTAGMRVDMHTTESPYFTKLWNWFNADGRAHVFDYLLTFPIPAKYNFAVEAGGTAVAAPTTTSTVEALQAGLGSIEQDIQAAIAEGREGFCGGWISSKALDILLAGTRKSGISRNKRTEILRGLEFVPHPGLINGQVNVDLKNGGGRPRLYINANHPSAKLTGAAVAVAYQAAQVQVPRA